MVEGFRTCPMSPMRQPNHRRRLQLLRLRYSLVSTWVCVHFENEELAVHEVLVGNRYTMCFPPECLGGTAGTLADRWRVCIVGLRFALAFE